MQTSRVFYGDMKSQNVQNPRKDMEEVQYQSTKVIYGDVNQKMLEILTKKYCWRDIKTF